MAVKGGPSRHSVFGLAGLEITWFGGVVTQGLCQLPKPLSREIGCAGAALVWSIVVMMGNRESLVTAILVCLATGCGGNIAAEFESEGGDSGDQGNGGTHFGGSHFGGATLTQSSPPNLNSFGGAVGNTNGGTVSRGGSSFGGTINRGGTNAGGSSARGGSGGSGGYSIFSSGGFSGFSGGTIRGGSSGFGGVSGSLNRGGSSGWSGYGGVSGSLNRGGSSGWSGYGGVSGSLNRGGSSGIGATTWGGSGGSSASSGASGSAASSSGGASGPPTCVPGATNACACMDGSSGAQLCGADGTFGVCRCLLNELRTKIIGDWQGTRSTAWDGSHSVRVSFSSNGHYSTFCADCTTMYWGTEADDDAKTYSIINVNSDAVASGYIRIVFSSNNYNDGEMRLISFDATGNGLTFSVFKGDYGPLDFVLSRH